MTPGPRDGTAREPLRARYVARVCWTLSPMVRSGCLGTATSAARAAAETGSWNHGPDAEADVAGNARDGTVAHVTTAMETAERTENEAHMCGSQGRPENTGTRESAGLRSP